jgi:hypothetical protein
MFGKALICKEPVDILGSQCQSIGICFVALITYLFYPNKRKEQTDIVIILIDHKPHEKGKARGEGNIPAAVALP